MSKAPGCSQPPSRAAGDGQVSTPKDQKKVRELKPKATLTVAIASKELGQDADAVKFRALAILNLGNPKGKRLSLGSQNPCMPC